MSVQLQEPKKNTCVACSAINVLRHFGQDVSTEGAVQACFVKRLGDKGSFTTKAAKYLMREHGMEAVCSRLPYFISDPHEAAREVVARWGALLAKGYVGILHHKVSQKQGHAVVLHGIQSKGDDWDLITYDSTARSTSGFFIYSAIHFLWFQPARKKLDLRVATKEQMEVASVVPSGRTAWFFRPSKLRG